jgi:hypothetical protein
MIQQRPTIPGKGPTLGDLSDGLLLGHVLPTLPAKDLITLSQVDRRFNKLSVRAICAHEKAQADRRPRTFSGSD